MSFNSFSFLFLFFPVFFILYRLIPRRYCAAALCAGGLIFYALGVRETPWQILLLVLMTGFAVLGCALVFAAVLLVQLWPQRERSD